MFYNIGPRGLYIKTFWVVTISVVKKNSRKLLTILKTLAYYVMEFIKAVKSFTMQALFYSYLTNVQISYSVSTFRPFQPSVMFAKAGVFLRSTFQMLPSRVNS